VVAVSITLVGSMRHPQRALLFAAEATVVLLAVVFSPALIVIPFAVNLPNPIALIISLAFAVDDGMGYRCISQDDPAT